MSIQPISEAKARIRKTAPDRPLVLSFKSTGDASVDLIVGHTAGARQLVADGVGVFVHKDTPPLDLAGYFLKIASENNE